MSKKKSLVEHLLEWASEREGPIVRWAKKRPILGKLFKEEGVEFKTLNRDECLGSLRTDLKSASGEVLLYCPFVSGVHVSQFLAMMELKDAINRGTKVKLVTRPPDDYDEKTKSGVSKTIKNLSEAGIEVYLRRGFHEKLILIDGRITYVGSANILSWPSASDIMQRVEDTNVAREMLAKIALPKEEEKLTL
jgi:phosphatidylserine/phosphatidylglycerophosphate/cardiolipin synthase-like enzyme